MSHIPYSVECRRDLTKSEIALISYILMQNAPMKLSELNNLKVVARCGCEKCPTIMFGNYISSAPKTGTFSEIAQYFGESKSGIPIGVSLLNRDNQISELEIWSPSGADIEELPEINTLKPVKSDK